MSLITRSIDTSSSGYKDAEQWWDDCMSYISTYMDVYAHMTEDQRQEIKNRCELIDKIVNVSHLVVGVGRVD